MPSECSLYRATSRHFNATSRLQSLQSSACVVQQFGTNFHRICGTLGNSLSVALSASYASVITAGGASDRRPLKARRTNGLTYVLTLLTYNSMRNWNHQYLQCGKHKSPYKSVCGIIRLQIVFSHLS